MVGSRKKNSIRNAIWGIFNKTIVFVGQFITRSIIIQVLGAEYLGINNLFIAILQVLNLTELGFSSAINYCLYKPMAENDISKICSLLNLYKKIYYVIGTIILVLGLMFTSFIPRLINQDIPKGINIYLLYWIYLSNTVISYYLFAYKNALITVGQRQDLLSKIHSVSQFIQYVLQINVLIFTKSMYLYVCSMVVCTAIQNILTQYCSKKYYPQYVCKGRVPNETVVQLKKLVMGIMVQKICQILRNSLDNICLSVFSNLTTVAIYGNYYFIMSAVVSFCSVFTASLSAAIGNSVAMETKEKNYNDMNKLLFVYSWLSGWCFICMICLYNPFMNIWVGSDLCFPFYMVFLFALYFYVLSMGDIRALYHSAAGLWWEGKSVWLLEAVFNLLLNIIFGKMWGALGIIVATILTVLFINFGIGTNILFKNYFTTFKIKDYYLMHLKYFCLTIIIMILTYNFCSLIREEGLLKFIFSLIICLIFPNFMYSVAYHKNKFFKYFKETLNQKVKQLVKGVCRGK